MFHLFLTLAASSLVAPPSDSTKLSRDSICISFEGNSTKPTQEALQSVYRLSNELFRSTLVKVDVLPAYRRPSQEQITDKRLSELRKVLIQEGVDVANLSDETLDDRNAVILQRKDRNVFCLITIESKPYFKRKWSAFVQREEPDVDTMVFLSSGIPINVGHRAYLAADTMPDIVRLEEPKYRQQKLKAEFEILHDYQVNIGSLKRFSFLIPFPEGKAEKQMVVYKSDSTGAVWKQIDHSGKVALGKGKALSIPVSEAGIYRVGYIDRDREQSVLLSMPKGYGVQSAKLYRSDGLEIPIQSAMGGTALAFQLHADASRYTITVKVVQADGRIIERIELPLAACMVDKVSDSSLGANSTLRTLFGSSIPNHRFRLPLDMLQNNLVNH